MMAPIGMCQVLFLLLCKSALKRTGRQNNTFEVTSLPESIAEKNASEGMLLLSTFVHLVNPGSQPGHGTAQGGHVLSSLIKTKCDHILTSNIVETGQLYLVEYMPARPRI